MAEAPVCCLSHAMNWLMVKVSGREEPEPEPLPEPEPDEGAGAGAAELTGLVGWLGAAVLVGAAEEAAGVVAAGLVGVAAGLVGVAEDEPPELAAPFQTAGPGIL